MSAHVKSSSRAFTLVELLVVIAIIGVLVALLLPAVQSARAAARRSQCQNNMKQVGLALLNYHSQNRAFPASSTWPTDDLGSSKVFDNIGKNWVIQVLPFMEQQPIYDAFDFSLPLQNDFNEAARSTSIAGLLCPEDSLNSEPFMGMSSSRTRMLGDNWARGNYAANASLGYMTNGGSHKNFDAATKDSPGWRNHQLRGVMGANVEWSIAKITDGTSNTILAAEIRAGVVSIDSRGIWAMSGGSSALWAHGYVGDGVLNSDDVIGCDRIVKVVGFENLMQMGMGCAPGFNYQQAPKSLHAGGFFATFVDGSVHWLSDNIEIKPNSFPETSVWDRLFLSADGEVLNAASF